MRVEDEDNPTEKARGGYGFICPNFADPVWRIPNSTFLKILILAGVEPIQMTAERILEGTKSSWDPL